MPRHAHHEPAPPGCCSCCHDCGGGCAPAPCYYPAPIPAPCYYPAPVPAPPGSASSASDHLLHAIAAHLLLGSSAPAPPPQPQQQQPQPPPAAHHAANPYPYRHQYQQQQEAEPHAYAHPPQPPAAHHAANPYPYQYQQQQEAKPHAYAHPPQPPAAHHAANPYPYHHQYQCQQQQEAKPHSYAHPPPSPPQPGASDHGHLILHSLLRRVAALESALPRCVPPPPPARRTPHPSPRPHSRAARQELLDDDDDDEEEEGSESSPPSPPQRRRPLRRHARAGPPPSSARELAARTIQAHFRRFLARRSRTLRQLKELAVLRSKAAALRGSVSGRRGGVDPAAVSEAAMGLLFRLDTIQGGDPMIREGKRAVSRELTRILEFVDKVLVKEHGQLGMGNALDNDDYREGRSAEFASNRPTVNKKVSFSNNGQIYELNGETDNVKVVDEDSESSGSAESDEMKGMPAKRSANGKTGIAAPTPMHMESRRVAGERR